MFKPIGFDSREFDPFRMIGGDWMLVTAEKDGVSNTMTASWGSFGVLWGKRVATVYIRDSRYTHDFADAAGRFTLTFFDKSRRDMLNYLGTVSGRDEDKIKKAGLTPVELGGAPAFEEAELAMVCRKLYSRDFEHGFYFDPSIESRFYPLGGCHTEYIAEIEGIYIKE